MATKFGTKIGYNSAYIRDIPEIFAYNRGFRSIMAYEINYLVTQQTKTLLTRPHSPTLGSKTANINVKKLTSLIV